MTEHRIDLDKSTFYVFWLKDPSGLPALELDLETNTYNVLVFTSEEAAQRYAQLKKPDLVNHITALSVTYGNKRNRIQAGLIKISRTCLFKMHNVEGFIFDHPGHTKAPCHYISMRDFLNSTKIKPANKTISDFIKQAEEPTT